jgi:hypothetical protein
MLDYIKNIGGNETSPFRLGNETAGNETASNETAGNETAAMNWRQ